jgi:hypothetical protein
MSLVWGGGVCLTPTLGLLARRHKLGLALAGGGFRASLFHLGVLYRMAELDLLRDVEVLSTVSGGSIVGALYVLILKRYLDAKPTLSQSDYQNIVEETGGDLIAGIQKNLRTRLFWNPLGILRALLTHDSLGRRMSRLYERHIYADAVRQLPARTGNELDRLGGFPLCELRFDPGGEHVPGGLENYNRDHASKIPNLILNATVTQFRYAVPLLKCGGGRRPAWVLSPRRNR